MSQPGLHETLFQKNCKEKKEETERGREKDEVQTMPGGGRGVLGKETDLASVWGMCEEGRRGKPKGQVESAVWKALHQSKGFRGIWQGGGTQE